MSSEYTVEDLMPADVGTDPALAEFLDSHALDFAGKEAEWLDGQIRQYFPAWLIDLANDPRMRMKNRLAVAALGIILKWKGIEVQRSTHYGMKNGKGFRPGVTIQTIEGVTSRVVRKGKIVAEKRFEMNIVIPNKTT